MKSDHEIVSQVKLALSILSGRRKIDTTSELSSYDLQCLRVEKSSSADDIMKAAEEIVAEVMLASLPKDAETVNLDEVAYGFLKHIEAQGGMIRRNRIPPMPYLDDDLIDKMEKKRVLVRGDGGLRWGSQALEFMRKFELEALEKGENHN